MISCPKCAKENQDHYKFCLGCGAELSRDMAAKAFSPETSPQVKAAAPVPPAASRAAAPAVQPPAAASRAAAPPVQAPVPTAPVAVAPPPAAPTAHAGSGPCPQCGHINATGNVFCGACGFRLTPAVVEAPKPVAAAPASVPGPSGIMLTALRPDGSIAGTYALPGGTTTLGRETGGVFAGDSYLSPKHATFRQSGGKLFVKDEASLNGVYRKLTRDVPVPLHPTDVFRIGQEIIRFEALEPLPPSPDGVERMGSPSKGYVGRISLMIGRQTTGNAFPVPDSGLQLGRERGDVLFPEDGYVSGLHCQILTEGGTTSLTDLGSSNGSFIRLRAEAQVEMGDVLLMGQQLFRIDAA